ncbi:glutaredoxin-C1 isoform X2 [Mangifera indica]|uniref:glutaredoxin-C1 isoform X2 n=1 Tax=Mangifera indica TaxID=29780 RepID=UPI001CFA4EAE|nr:glutaredoxin-C1 isoform X2 [Mangifera indica]
MGLAMSLFSSKEELETTIGKAKDIAASAPVVVFSKTYCGYCARVKQLLTKLGATYKVMEVKFNQLWQSGLSKGLYLMCSLGENTSVAVTLLLRSTREES